MFLIFIFKNLQYHQPHNYQHDRHHHVQISGFRIQMFPIELSSRWKEATINILFIFGGLKAAPLYPGREKTTTLSIASYFACLSVYIHNE